MFPAGKLALAGRYMKSAGYPSGRYTGGKTVQIAGATGNPFAPLAEIVNHAVQSLGFKTNLTLK